ncbi:hypothetical protein HAHE_25500 [Haloferula helveola]|uniref:Cytochrome c n=1 Tax=Haloferula helveola TaxID=490095 RepID=A0ABN6H4Q7_9BACT|nr:hypothetical protein HAHE_25500 [Haloferula helveola]
MRLALLALACIPAARADLTATFTSGGATDTRTDRLPAIYVEKGESPTPFLAPGPFEVTWTGKLVIAERQRLYFSFEGDGSAALTVNGEEVLHAAGQLAAEQSERIRLNPGEHDVSVTYKSLDDGSGQFRLFWEERSFPRQSIPPTAFKTESKSSPERMGRELFAANHCAKCHLPASGLGSKPMAEMLEIAPILADSGGRLTEEWLAQWIASPASLKPDTRMPALVDASTDEGKQQAADLAAWLVTLKIADAPAAPDAGLAQKGGEHFHRFGCVACHNVPGAKEPDPGRVPLDRVAQKFQPGALVDFLKQPDKWYPHIGMPDFGLSDDEAQSIAAWLLAESGKNKHKDHGIPDGDATKGAELAKQLNCGACHAGLPLDVGGVPSLEAIFEKDWSKDGCLTARKDLPRFNLTDEESSALAAFSKTGAEPLKRHVPAEYASAKLESLRCTSCHDIDEVRSLLATTHIETKDLVAHIPGENEKLDQSRPHLTFIGEMLHASYLESMIDGKASPRPRPWLDMRMPAFHSHASGLAEGLAKMHGVPPGPPAKPEPDADLAAIGKTLISADGFGCNTCHAVGDTKATAAFEVEGVNFALAHDRLRKEWFMRWMANPLSVTPDTKMPVYSENGESQRTDILEGDAAAQFDAIWNYLLSVSE